MTHVIVFSSKLDVPIRICIRMHKINSRLNSHKLPSPPAYNPVDANSELATMELEELTKDLFALPEAYLLAHCISSDARMGRGIAVAFCKNFDLASLQASAKETPLEIGRCYREGRVLNLVTRQKYSGKPTYASLRQSLASMRGI